MKVVLFPDPARKGERGSGVRILRDVSCHIGQGHGIKNVIITGTRVSDASVQ